METAEDPVVELDNVTFRWPGQTVDTVSIGDLSLRTGEHLFVRGASGSGKTTLLNLLAGIHVPTSGTIRLLGTDVGTLSASQRDRFRANHIGVVFQQFNLLPYLSVMENVTISSAFTKDGRSQRDLNGTAQRLLRSLNLPDEMHDASVSKLSVGQQQRVAVARALLGGPEILIADEPTSALDADNRDRFLDLLFQEVTAADATLIFVSHDPQLSKRFGRVIELSESGTEAAAPA